MARPFAYSAESLQFIFDEYLEWIKSQGYYKPELIKSGDLAGTIAQVLIPKPLSVESFCLFAKIDIGTFYNYLNSKQDDKDRALKAESVKEESDELTEHVKLFNASTRIRDYIRDYRIGGAECNVLNANIVSKVYGLTENINVKADVTKEVINITIDGKDLDIT